LLKAFLSATSKGTEVRPKEPPPSKDASTEDLLRALVGKQAAAGGDERDICWDHKRGNCSRGSGCRYRHE
jgi:hypothetical protein